MMRLIIPLLLFSNCIFASKGEDTRKPAEPRFSEPTISAREANHGTNKAEENTFSMDFGVSAGTTGLGFEADTKLSKWIHVRIGASFMPHMTFSRNMSLSVMDKNGQNAISASQTKQIYETMNNLVGTKPNTEVRFNRTPTMNNAKILVDVYPLKNKHWHATAGLYYGNETVIKGENDINDAPTLMIASMYNNIHRIAVNEEPIIIGNTYTYLSDDVTNKLLSYGKTGIIMGKFTNDICNDEGEIIHSKGDMFLLEPDASCMVTEKVTVNKFRPYIGFGYSHGISKKDERWTFGFDMGIMFWGGHPSVIMTRKEQTSEYNEKKDKFDVTNKYYDIDITRDITDYNSRYIDFMKKISAYPVLDLRLAYRIF